METGVGEQWEGETQVTFDTEGETRWRTNCMHQQQFVLVHLCTCYHTMYCLHDTSHLSQDVLPSWHYSSLTRCTAFMTLFIYHTMYCLHDTIHLSHDVLPSWHYSSLTRCTAFITLFISHTMYCLHDTIHLSQDVLPSWHYSSLTRCTAFMTLFISHTMYCLHDTSHLSVTNNKKYLDT